MQNYKVHVSNKAESKEVQGLFEQLGCRKGVACVRENGCFVGSFDDHEKGWYSSTSTHLLPNHKELTIQQLRYLVAAKTNKIPTQPEELPFIDDEPKRDDNVNHPSHYTQGSIECIEALEAATVNKHGIEAVCVANVIKYLWRYESKNGLEDVKKAQWYLQKLVDKLEQNNG